MAGGLFEEIYRVVTEIPRGKVATYGQVAQILNIRDTRVVGWALHKNKNLSVPCYRVVKKDGSLASGYAFGGRKAQRKKLLADGVGFKSGKVFLPEYLWLRKKIKSVSFRQSSKRFLSGLCSSAGSFVKSER